MFDPEAAEEVDEEDGGDRDVEIGCYQLDDLLPTKTNACIRVINLRLAQ